MKMEELFEKYGCDTQHKEQAVFASIFILQNRLQTAGEKLQTEISMKQWLLLAMAECCPEPRTLTNIGELMGCCLRNTAVTHSIKNRQFLQVFLFCKTACRPPVKNCRRRFP